MPNVAEPERRAGGVWTVGVWPGHADELVRALDPDLRYVVVEDHGPGARDWVEAPVSLAGEEPRPRTVRDLGYTLLLTPAEAVAAGPAFRAAGDGSLLCWQSAVRPGPAFRLRDSVTDSSLGARMRGLDVVLAVYLPHDGEAAVLYAPDEAPLRAAIARLA